MKVDRKIYEFNTGRRVPSSGMQIKAEPEPQDLLHQDHGEILDKIQLLGQPSLKKYLNFVRDKVVDGASLDRKSLVEEWCLANDYYQELEETETGIADEIEVLALPPALTSLAAEVEASPLYCNAFNKLPTHFGMVELDRLALYQTSVIGQFTELLQTQLGPAPDPVSLFRFCQPPTDTKAPVKIRKVGSNRYVFTSESTDFRPHDPVIFRPDQISDHKTFGPLSGVVGLAVGYGSNFLTAIRHGDDGRVVLHNGYHRAYAMRASGITHAPCIIQTVSRYDELEVSAAKKINQDPDFYFASARPPLLKDFFDPKIRKAHKVYKTVKMIEVEFKIREFYVGA